MLWRLWACCSAKNGDVYKRQVLIHLSIKIDIPLMLGYFGHIFNLPMKFFATRKTGDITTRYSDANLSLIHI